MSAELLQRAAERLRANVARLPETWCSNPWRAIQTDTENTDGIAACANAHHDDPTGAYDCCWSSESTGHEAVAAHIAMMHPPVALALADLLQRSASVLPGLGPMGEDLASIARAILREDS